MSRLKKGEVFGRLTIIRQVDDRIRSNGYPRHYYLTECICGNRKEVEEYKLKSGHTESCGCKRFQNKPLIKNHKFFNRACNILRRCNDPKCPEYKYYGNRGIKCRLGNKPTEVVKSLEKIKGYFEGSHIDRINNDGDYEIGNLRWVTCAENQRNRRDHVDLESLSSKPRTKRQAKLIINRLGYDFDDFSSTYVRTNKFFKREFTFKLV